MIKKCCVCRKTEQKGEWVREIDTIPSSVSHGYCPQCYVKLMDEINQFALQKWENSVHMIVSVGQL